MNKPSADEIATSGNLYDESGCRKGGRVLPPDLYNIRTIRILNGVTTI